MCVCFVERRKVKSPLNPQLYNGKNESEVLLVFFLYIREEEIRRKRCC